MTLTALEQAALVVQVRSKRLEVRGKKKRKKKKEKRKKLPHFHAIALARTERFELSRQFPDLYP